MTSSLLLIGPPRPEDFLDLGPAMANTLAEASGQLAHGDFGVVGAIIESAGPAETVKALEKYAEAYLVISAPHWRNEDWYQLTARFRVFRIFHKFELETFKNALAEALERWQGQRQDDDFIQLMAAENSRLKLSQVELEDRAHRRQASLARSRQRLQKTINDFEVLKAAFLAVHRARSLTEMEDLLVAALTLSFKVEGIRLRFHSQSSMAQVDFRSELAATRSVPLYTGDLRVGEMIVLAHKNHPLGPEDINLLNRVAEAAALGLDRLAKLEQAELVKREWEATFDAISEPLCLTDSTFRIIKNNRAYAEATGKTFRELIGGDAFRIFFGHSQETPSSSVPGQRLRLERTHKDQIETYEVSIHQPITYGADDSAWVLLFRNITSRLVLERQLVESSKLAELGLIGSSIAHELNNPLGGMLSFIQLIRMDLSKESELFPDVQEMEQAAFRCRDIVQNLLGFARKSDAEEKVHSDLREIIQHAVRIADLKARPQGVRILVDELDEPVPVYAQTDHLTQAVCNILQNSTEAILQKRQNDPKERGEIRIHIDVQEPTVSVRIIDSGGGIDPTVKTKVLNPLFSTKATEAHPGLGLTVAHRILREHQGSLTISSQVGVGTEVVLSLPTEERPGGGRVFDWKI